MSFAAGKETSELLITFDRTKLEDGKEYPISFLLNDEDNTTPYGNRSLDIVVAPWPWVELGTGKFRDDYLCSMFNGGNPEIEVTIHKHKSKAGIYMVEEMYGWPFLTEFFEGSQEAIESQVGLTYTPVNITIDWQRPDESGHASSVHGYYRRETRLMAIMKSPVHGRGRYAGKRVITFPQEALAFVCSAGNLKANKSGLFRILLPDAELTDYTLSAVYDGMKVSADGETASAVINFTYGADVTNIRYVLVENELTEAETATLVAAIADGSAENINEFQDFTVGGEKVSAEAVLPQSRNLYQ